MMYLDYKLWQLLWMIAMEMEVEMGMAMAMEMDGGATDVLFFGGVSVLASPMRV